MNIYKYSKYIFSLLLCLTLLNAKADNAPLSAEPLNEVLDRISEKYRVIITYNTAQLSTTRIQFELIEGEKLESAVNRALSKTQFKFKQLTSKYFIVYDEKNSSKKNISKLKKKFKEIQEIEKMEGLDVQKVSKNTPSTIKKIMSVAAELIDVHTVSGIVQDNSGQPLIGASILEKGTSNGTVTDLDGAFTINVADENAVLVISFLSYMEKEIPLGGQSQLTITLEEDAAELNEVVVIGYGSKQKKDITGSIVSVKAEDFTQGANYSAAQLLNGAAAGVNVSQVSSAPGAGLRVQIRGAGSINSDNSVLFVVDGLPGVDPLSLSPGDIESIDVLKDASSAAIYGTRAANGVVLITTKKGRAGKTVLNYNNYIGFQSVSKSLDVLGGRDYANLINLRAPGTYTDAQISSFGDGTNWQDQIFTEAVVHNHQLSLSGGSDKSSYYLGLNYFDQEGIVRNSGSDKYNFRINIQSNPLDRLKISANANFTRQRNDEILFSNGANEGAGPINSAIQFDPTLSAGLDENGRFFRNAAIALDNPLALIEGIDNQRVLNRFYASVNSEYSLTDAISATIRIGAESNNSRFDSFNSRVTLNGLGAGGSAVINQNSDTHWLAEALLNYTKTFNQDHNIKVLGGVTFEEFLFQGVGASSANFLSDVTGTDLLQSGNGDLNDNVNSFKFVNRLNGFIGRGSYDFKNKYFLTASFRVDGSSRFAENSRYAFFPSASFGWRITQEDFMAENNTFDELKLRVGYGELGNQGINNFETRQTLVSEGSNAVFGGNLAQGVVVARLANPALKWETTRELNIGVDFAILDYKLSGSVDYFNRNTFDQLFEKPLPSVVGFNSVRTNLGSVKNSGVDFNLSSWNIKRQDFEWKTNLNIALLKNEVTELPDFTQEIITGNIGTFINQFTIVREGDPLRSFYGYEIEGIIQEGEDIQSIATPDVAGYQAGMPRFTDQNNDGVIDANDRVVLGNPFPDLTFGFNNSVRYKNFSFEVFLQGVQGIETLDANITESLYPTNDSRNTIARYYDERWTPQNPSNTLPSGVTPSLYGGARAINSLTVVDASFIRLKNITVIYAIPLSEYSSISGLNIYLGIDNLLTITDYEGFDPDASAVGDSGIGSAGPSTSAVSRVAYNSYPLAKTFRIGLDVNF